MGDAFEKRPSKSCSRRFGLLVSDVKLGPRNALEAILEALQVLGWSLKTVGSSNGSMLSVIRVGGLSKEAMNCLHETRRVAWPRSEG